MSKRRIKSHIENNEIKEITRKSSEHWRAKHFSNETCSFGNENDRVSFRRNTPQTIRDQFSVKMAEARFACFCRIILINITRVINHYQGTAQVIKKLSPVYECTKELVHQEVI